MSGLVDTAACMLLVIASLDVWHPALLPGLEAITVATGNRFIAGEAYEGGDGSGVALEVAGKASVAADPSQGSFDHPSFWQDDEAPGDIGSLDDLDLPSAGSRGCGANARSLIAAIGVDALDEGELSSRSFVEHQRRAIAVLDIGGMNDDIQ
jgi:hypothetical protein